MKKITYFPAVLFLFVACSSGKSSTASYIKVIDKGATDNQQWIIAKIGDDNETKELKILVPEKNTWNLFQKGVDYFVSYSTEKNENNLVTVKYPSVDGNDQK